MMEPWGTNAQGFFPFLKLPEDSLRAFVFHVHRICWYSLYQELKLRGFLGGPMAKAPNPGGPGLIPGQGTRSHMLQLRPSAAK